MGGEIMKKKILVVDDSPFMLQTIGDILKKLNYDVATAENGAAACRSAQATRFDMIITDLNMSGMDGIQFTQQVKSYPSCKFVPIVMISSETDQDKIARAKKVGISTFLSKPIKESQLSSLLQVVLNKRKTPRIPLNLEVCYGADGVRTDFTSAQTFNVSLGGLFVETSAPLPSGEQLNLKLTLAEHDPPFTCRGRVAWVNDALVPCNPSHPPGMGIEFLEVDQEDRLQRRLQRRLQETA